MYGVRHLTDFSIGTGFQNVHPRGDPFIATGRKFRPQRPEMAKNEGYVLYFLAKSLFIVQISPKKPLNYYA